MTENRGNPNLALEDCVVHQLGRFPTFRRCDPNADGQLDASDALWILSELFQHGAQTECPEAADCNGDETNDLSDAVYALLHQFLGGPPPPAPFPDCGPSEDFRECPIGSAQCEPL